jgi:hypothetical protein
MEAERPAGLYFGGGFRQGKGASFSHRLGFFGRVPRSDLDLLFYFSLQKVQKNLLAIRGKGSLPRLSFHIRVLIEKSLKALAPFLGKI